MISQLSAKYQFGAIHTLTQRILEANRALFYKMYKVHVTKNACNYIVKTSNNNNNNNAFISYRGTPRDMNTFDATLYIKNNNNNNTTW